MILYFLTFCKYNEDITRWPMTDLSMLPDEAAKRYAQLLDRAVKMTKQERARDNFIDYVNYV